jgi:hypothetical protein
MTKTVATFVMIFLVALGVMLFHLIARMVDLLPTDLPLLVLVLVEAATTGIAFAPIILGVLTFYIIVFEIGRREKGMIHREQGSKPPAEQEVHKAQGSKPQAERETQREHDP